MGCDSVAYQHVVITGGSSGIGLCLAQDLARRGARLTLLGRDLAKLEQAAAQVESPVQVASVDVSDEAAVDAAIEALGRTLALELELAPCRVNVVTPGMIDTPLWSARLSAEAQRAHFERIGQALPVGRAGTPQDVAHAVRFLLENGFTTGAVLDVDGGQR